MKKIAFKDFIKDDYDIEEYNKLDPDMIKDWHNQNIHLSLIDAYGEANYAINLFKENKRKTNESIINHLKSLHKVATLICSDKKVAMV